jgi:glutamate racemase
MNEAAIGVFDSGVGGLTVLQALQHHCPEENFIYLGDTARLPYGTKSPTTVIDYARQVTKTLLTRDIKLLVVACNTASALALPSLQQEFNTIPIIGVIEPSAKAAANLSPKKAIAVLATEATVQAQGYQVALQALNPMIAVHTQSAGLLVALAEEGWLEGPLVEGILHHYLTPLLARSQADCLLLGCTHFPILQASIARVIDPQVAIVNSAHATAEAVRDILLNKQLSASRRSGTTKYWVTDCPERFVRVAAYFLQQPLQLDAIECVDVHLP